MFTSLLLFHALDFVLFVLVDFYLFVPHPWSILPFSALSPGRVTCMTHHTGASAGGISLALSNGRY
jgi:hypothetical protein